MICSLFCFFVGLNSGRIIHYDPEIEPWHMDRVLCTSNVNLFQIYLISRILQIKYAFVYIQLRFWTRSIFWVFLMFKCISQQIEHRSNFLSHLKNQSTRENNFDFERRIILKIFIIKRKSINSIIATRSVEIN